MVTVEVLYPWMWENRRWKTGIIQTVRGNAADVSAGKYRFVIHDDGKLGG